MVTIGQNFVLGVAGGIILTILISTIVFFLFGRSFILKKILEFFSFFVIVNSLIVVGILLILHREIIDETTASILIASGGPIVAWLYLLVFSDLSSMVRTFKSIQYQTAYIAQKDLISTNQSLTTKRYKEMKKISENIDTARSSMTETLEVTSILSNQINHSARTIASYSKDIIEFFDRMNLSKNSFDSIRDQASLSLDNLSQELTSLQQKLSSNMNVLETKLKGVTEISNQTKIVAINAAIEASQSNQSESGFELVAGDVTDLSNRVNSATEVLKMEIRSTFYDALNGLAEIETYLNNLMSIFKNFMEGIDKMTMDVETRGGSISTLVSNLQDLSKSSENLNKLISEYKY